MKRILTVILTLALIFSLTTAVMAAPRVQIAYLDSDSTCPAPRRCGKTGCPDQRFACGPTVCQTGLSCLTETSAAAGNENCSVVRPPESRAVTNGRLGNLVKSLLQQCDDRLSGLLAYLTACANGKTDRGSEQEVPIPSDSGCGQEAPVPSDSSSGQEIPAPSDSGSEQEVPIPSDSGSGQEIPTPSDSSSGQEIPAPSDSSSGQEIPAPSDSGSGQEAPAASDNGNIDNLSYEEQVVSLVNGQRAAYGLSPLSMSKKLSDVARAKSQDMHDNRYFSHNSPTYGSPFEMMRAFGISYRTAGENIAMGYSTPEAVVNGWMNSPGHRANILNSSFTEIGVGYVADGNYWTQQFIG